MSVNANDTIKVRIRFSRSAGAKFISHLDQLRTLARAVNRSGLPVWHTEGFNPHPYLVFTNPLSVGFTAKCEIMDLRLTGDVPMDEVRRRLNAAMPPDFAVTDAYVRTAKPSEIGYALYSITLTARDFTSEALLSEAEKMLSLKELWVEKSAKRSKAETDIRPMIKDYKLSIDGNGLYISAVLAASSEKYLNPEYLFRAMERYIKDFELDCKSVCRGEFYTRDMTVFR